jgi:hypothetical protein
MAGPHQSWKLDLDGGEVSLFAGSGREGRGDGKRLGDFEDESVAIFAQPSGLAAARDALYVADAESNVIRAVSLSAAPNAEEVRTLAGGDLFEFGDRDGEGDEVRLQHPLGLALDEAGRLFVADTYNHKIKVLDPRARKVKTFAGTGKPGQTDGERATFYEPGGLSVARGKLYVADTNNHAVRVIDLADAKTTTLAIRGLTPPAPDLTASNGPESSGPNAEELKAETQRLAASSEATLSIDVALPAGHHLNASAPQRYAVEVSGGPRHLSLGTESERRDGKLSAVKKDLKLPLRLGLRAGEAGASELRVRLTLYYCREDDTGVCRVKTLAWRVPVEVTREGGAPREIRLRAKVE